VESSRARIGGSQDTNMQLPTDIEKKKRNQVNKNKDTKSGATFEPGCAYYVSISISIRFLRLLAADGFKTMVTHAFNCQSIYSVFQPLPIQYLWISKRWFLNMVITLQTPELARLRTGRN
jgi:hypothetical protein